MKSKILPEVDQISVQFNTKASDSQPAGKGAATQSGLGDDPEDPNSDSGDDDPSKEDDDTGYIGLH